MAAMTDKPLHATMERLFAAARELQGADAPADVARLLNVSDQTINNWSRRGISKEGMLAAQERIGCNATWIATGSGPMRVRGAEHISAPADKPISGPDTGKFAESPREVAATMTNEPSASQGSAGTDGRASVSARPILAWDREEELGDEYVLIPRLDVKFSAGNGKIVWHIDEKGQKQAFRRAWCQRLGINPDHAATIVNEGQSMESRIQDGDSLVVDYQATRILDGKVFALAYRDELYIKRLFKLPSGGLIVRSDNPDKARFPDINLTAEDMEFVEIIAQVKGVSGGV